MMAVELIEQTLRDGVPVAPILRDAVYGDNAQFRHRLQELELEFFLQIDPGKHKGWDHQVGTEVKRLRWRVDLKAPPS